MTVEFQYTFDDLDEARAAHKPRAHQTSRRHSFLIAIAVGVAAAWAIISISWTTNVRRPLHIDMIMPGIALLVFWLPLLAYRQLTSRGIRGLLRAADPFRAGLTTFIIIVCLSFLLLLYRSASATGTPEPPGARWKAVSDILLPHTTWLLISGLLCWWVFRLGERQALEMWKGGSHLHRPFIMTITDDGLSLTEPLARHHLKWFAFDRIIETQNLFLLYIADYSFHMIPKRAFADARQIDEFRALLDNRITRRPAAFPVLPVAG